MKLFQITIDGKAAAHVYSDAHKCMDQMRMIKQSHPKEVVSFLEIDI